MQNLILIEYAEVHFGPHLNIITGETGSGKSAILSAIRLLAGGRADVQEIREGADFAVVEATLEGPIHVRREIYRSGKNRCFIDEAQVSLAILRETMQIEQVDQSSAALLASVEQQRHMLDAYANILDQVAAHEKALIEERALENRLQALKLDLHQKEKELQLAQQDLNLLEELQWQEGEELRLNEEHRLLTHGQELLEKLSTVTFTLTEGGELTSFKQNLALLEHASHLDETWAPFAQTMKNALLELKELGLTLRSSVDRIEIDPHRLAIVEKRIGILESLKRRFGPDIASYKKSLEEKLRTITESSLEAMQQDLLLKKEQNLQAAHQIKEARRAAAIPFEKHILTELKSLNLPHAQFRITEQNRFLFAANLGQMPIALEECASGGELSRVLLAIKVLLARQEKTLVLDEIDSNVGGQTAALLGAKLHALSQKGQIICVTHFVQVAKCATDHYRVRKIIHEGGVRTLIEKLDAKEKEKEYLRMLGSGE